MILSRLSTLWGFVVVCFFLSFSACFIPSDGNGLPGDSIMEQQTNEQSRAEYDDWIRPYTARPPILRRKDGEIRIKLILTAISGDEQNPSDREPSVLSRLNDMKVSYGCQVFEDGRVHSFYHSSRGAKGGSGSTIPENELKRLDHLLANLPDDGARLPPGGRRLVVQVADADHFRVRVYDRANAPSEILEILRLTGSGIRSQVPTFKPSSEWAANEGENSVQLCLSPDGREIITLDSHVYPEISLKFWNPDTREMLREVRIQHNLSVSGLKPGPDGIIAEIVQVPHDSGPYLSISPDGSIAMLDHEGEIQLLNTRTWRSIRKFAEPWIGRNKHSLSHPQFTPDGRYLLIQNSKPELKVYETKMWRRRAALPGAPQDAIAYFPAPTANRAIYFSRSDVVALWHPDQQRIVASLDDSARIHRVAFSPDESLVAIATVHKDKNNYWGMYRIRIWRMEDGEMLHELRPGEQNIREEVKGLLWWHDGNYLLASLEGETYWLGGIWSVKTGRHRAELTGCTSDITGLVSLGDGRRMAAGCGDGHIRIWDVESAIKQIAE
jgi:WD40 repeat protein